MFWCIVLSFFTVTGFLKSEHRNAQEKRDREIIEADKLEKEKQQRVIEMFTEALRPEPLSPEEV